MRRTLQSLRRLTSRRATLDRRGSMLIMVIVILVLLALIGTAMISTSRIDRVSTAQHGVNVQADLLLQSVKNLAIAAITDELFGTDTATNIKRYKPTKDNVPTFKSYTSLADSWYLAARIPRVPDQAAIANNAGNPPLWSTVSLPLLGTQFAAPNQPPFLFNTTYNKGQYFYRPTTGNFGGQIDWPMLEIHTDTDNDGIFDAVQTVPGVDTDGDGVADAGLFLMPVGELSGVTYYAASRIIDQNSAVNVSTAWKYNDDEIDPTLAKLPIQLFPNNIDLVNFMADSLTELPLLNAWRYNDTGGLTNYVAIDDTNAARTDFRFMSKYDAAWHQYGRRLAYPGYNFANKYRSPLDSDAIAMGYPFAIYEKSIGNSNLGTLMPTSLQTNVPKTPFKGAVVDAWYNQCFDFVNIPRATRPLRSVTVVHNPVSPASNPHEMQNTDLTKQLPQGLTLAANATLQPNGMALYKSSNPMQATIGLDSPVPKVSINTADFPELWRGFWNVMCVTPNTAGESLEWDTLAGKLVNKTFVDNTVNFDQTKGKMFSSVLRPPGSSISPPGTAPAFASPCISTFEMLQLRAALASVNAMDLRDADDDVTSRKVLLYRADGTNMGAPTYEATVYGTEKQPFITEVYVNTDNVTAGAGGVNPKGYVAIELHNPHSTDILLKNWTLGVIDRREGVTYPLKIRRLTPPTGGTAVLPFQTLVIPANGYVVLENLPAVAGTNVANDATYRPASFGPNADITTFPPGAAPFVYVPNLHEVLPDPAIPITAGSYSGSEVVLLRPRKASGVPSASVSTKDPFNETNITLDPNEAAAPTNTPLIEQAMADMVPVDSYDFTNILLAPATPTPTQAYQRVYYNRSNGAGKEWKFVYPGNYIMAPGASRHETPRFETWLTPAVEGSLPPLDPVPNFGSAGAVASYANEYPPIQLNPKDFGGPNGAAPFEPTRQYYKGDVVQVADANYRALAVAPVTVTPPPTAEWEPVIAGGEPNSNRFPFGCFARLGDLLQIPYIGAYRLRELDTSTGAPLAAFATTPSAFTEMNAVTIDCQFARDGSAGDANDPDASEHLGRFIPRSAAQPDFPLVGATPKADNYAWAGDLFDYFTVAAPHDDYLPAVNPLAADVTAPASLAKYGGTVPPVKISNTSSAPADLNAGADLTAPLEGLININTAPWFVIAQLPFFAPTQDLMGVDSLGNITATPNGVADNADIAKLIVGWRDGNSVGYTKAHGAFTSIYDLNKIIGPLPAHNPTTGTPPGKTFQNGFGLLATTLDPDDIDGDVSPRNTVATPVELDKVRDDFEEKFLMINRVSNMITTRSDQFMVYVVLQGWRNVSGGGTPEMVVQRRAAMMVDRSAVYRLSDSPKVTSMPTE